MKLILAFFASVVCSLAADAPSPAGDWQGTLRPGPIELRIALKIEQSAAGLKASMVSVDQGTQAISASNAKLEGAKLTMEFPAINGSYDAQVSADGKTLTGTWSQGGNSLPLNMTRGAVAPDPPEPADPSAAPLVGIWEGALDTGTVKLRLRFTLRKGDKGEITGTADSLDQNSTGMPMSKISLKDNAFHFDLKGVGGMYDGTVDEKRTIIKGTWRQGPGELPLEWKKVDKPSAHNRQQNPAEPYPHRVEHPNAKAARV